MIKKVLASAALLGVSLSSFGYFTYTLKLQNATPFPMELTSLLAQQMDWHFPENIDPNQTIEQKYEFWISGLGNSLGNDGGDAVYVIQCPNGEFDQLTIRASVKDDWHFKGLETYLRLKAVLSGNHCTILVGGNSQTIVPMEQPNFALVVQQKQAEEPKPPIEVPSEDNSDKGEDKDSEQGDTHVDIAHLGCCG